MEREKVMVVQAGDYEKIADEGLACLRAANYELVFPKNVNTLWEEESLKECQAMIVRGLKITRKTIAEARRLRVIARCGVGTDNIDVQAALDHGIAVCNVPDANFTSVAEHVIGMMVALSHQVVRADKALRQGQFNARHHYVGNELKGKTVGVIGYGRIGRLVAKKCAEGLDMRVLAFDPYVKPPLDDPRVRLVDVVDAVLTEADFITLHLPYVPELRHFIDRRAFAKMKPTAYLLNCARGGLVDEEALVEAIQTGEIAGAGIDVFEDEPPHEAHPLFGLDNVIVTPHMAASTKESLALMAIGAAEEIIRVLKGEKPLHDVTRLVTQG